MVGNPQAPASLLEVSSLSKWFGGVHAVRDVSFSVAAGEIVAVIGPNGAGKTTLFNLIHGELGADGGDVRFAGRSTLGLATHAIADLGIGRTFQIAANFPSMKVRESLALAIAAKEGTYASMRGLLDVAASRCDESLRRFGIDDLADTHCAALSYGDAKRVELALALVGEPELLMMDEPTAGMAPRSRRELMQLAVELARQVGAAVIFTEHDMDIVFGFAQRVIVLDRGELIVDGSPQRIRDDAKVHAAYLGSRFGMRPMAHPDMPTTPQS
jgi:branched-chain amino acid transport system ATP-binding protein